MKKIEADSLEDALIKASNEFNCSVIDLEYEIIQNPSKGFLGFGKKSSIICVEPKIKTTKEESKKENPQHLIHKTPSSLRQEKDIAIIAKTIQQELKELLGLLPYNIHTILVKPYDENTLYIKLDGEDSALLIGKEGYRYKAISYLLFNWINHKYGLMVRLEIAEFLKNQEEMIANYLLPIIETIKLTGKAQTKPLDGVLAHIAITQLREQFPNKYIAFRLTTMGKGILSLMTSITHSTIVAPATTYGNSSLNVIRLSGTRSLDIASQLAKKDLTTLQPRFAKLTKIYFENNILLDECIIIYFKSPHSYTTEDVVEFQCHGGTFIAKNIIEECIKYGAILAKPGEFTKRAFLGGRIDLTQAQAIAKLIQSNNAQAHKMLMRHLKGEMQDFCELLRESLLKILAHSEVFIDYADEELPQNLLQSIQKQLDSILQTLSSLSEKSYQKRNLFEGYKICIIGKPNVGKSSLLNALLEDNRAIVSDIAGTTRDSIEENFILDGHLLRLIDTAGIRKNADIIENEGIQRSLEKAKDSDLLLVLFDNSRILDDEDLTILHLLKEYKDSKKIVVIINKIDLKNCFNQQQLTPFKPLLLSLKNKDSLQSLKNHLKTILSSQDDNHTLLLTSQYQFETIQTCIQALQSSIMPLQNGELELFSFHINEAIQAIASLTKPYEYSQMLDKMFSDFCLGK